MERVAPILMICNEENYIMLVIRNLLKVFPKVYVADTGSTDETLAQILLSGEYARARIKLWTYSGLSLAELGQIRFEIGKQARQLFGAEWAFQVDGDELYHVDALRYIVDNPMPEGKLMGFTKMVSVDRDADGNYWELSDVFSRAAIFPITDTWTGDYPFETPLSFFLGKEHFHYFDLPFGYKVHGYHLHPLDRSSKDNEVPLRLEKQKQFSMQPQKHSRVTMIGDKLPGE